VRRLEPFLILAAAVAFAVPAILTSRPSDWATWLGTVCLVLGAGCLAGWRRYPRAVLVVGPALMLVPLFLGPDVPDLYLAFLAAYAALVAERFGGRSAWLAGLAAAGYLALIYRVSGDTSVGLAMLTLPAYVAGLVVRSRRETAEQLAERARELDEEREIFARVSVGNERARIASELHDIVGHALSVMVVQAAAGQRLVERKPAAVRSSLEAIAASARQGRADLQRLIELLAGSDVAAPDLALVDEIVAQAARSGLRVTCRFEGDRDGVDARAAHVAFRVVQEGVTNALRYAPGAAVRILVRAEPDGRRLTVRVRNDAGSGARGDLSGSGRGLIGLRERVAELGGRFQAGPAPAGGWQIEAELPNRRSVVPVDSASV
jgi:signal transduction histidine kinase